MFLPSFLDLRANKPSRSCSKLTFLNVWFNQEAAPSLLVKGPAHTSLFVFNRGSLCVKWCFGSCPSPTGLLHYSHEKGQKGGSLSFKFNLLDPEGNKLIDQSFFISVLGRLPPVLCPPSSVPRPPALRRSSPCSQLVQRRPQPRQIYFSALLCST